jgi:hypothetical protein
VFFVCSLQVPEPASSSPSPAAAHSADRHQRSSLLRAAHLHRIRAKAEDESRKVDEVPFINNLTNAGKKADLQQRLEEGEGSTATACSTQQDLSSSHARILVVTLAALAASHLRSVRPIMHSCWPSSVGYVLFAPQVKLGAPRRLQSYSPSSRRQQQTCARQRSAGGRLRLSGLRSWSTGRGASKRCRYVCHA